MSQKGFTSPEQKQPWPTYRSRHRQRSHDQAHAEQPVESNDGAASAAAFSHSLVASGPVDIVADSDDLNALIEDLRCAKSFGYDSEFIGEHSYFPELCLIQVATAGPTGRVALIDPMAGLDLTLFWALLADPNVEKLVHAGQPDLEPVVRHLNQPPRDVFDVQIVAAFAGLPYPMALSKLLKELTGTELLGSSRSVKFSQWNKRPLSPAQLQYAADDVRYLP